ncbi:MAG: DUF882 domain-containing protein [Candidatus Margulisbacteria bacterium]|nr:DUF882 domain-containing protein [Candidatus Margulisiibacteriota bacterium]
MGNLSEHFNNKDFACRCPECKGEYKIHLGLVGALEQIGSHFRKKVKIISGFWCDAFHEKQNKTKRSLHAKGKAAHISIDGVAPQELFKYAETVPELRGVGFYPKENWVHIDTRPGDPIRFVKEGNDYHQLTPEKRTKYGL